MCCGANFLKKFFVFVLTLTIGLLGAGIFQARKAAAPQSLSGFTPVEEPTLFDRSRKDLYSQDDKVWACKKNFSVSVDETKPLKILAKPKASYTEEARAKQIHGKVVLKITFLASGQIGGIFPVTKLPDGLTEQAIAAAREIRFEPATKNGQAVSVTKTVEYNFTIY